MEKDLRALILSLSGMPPSDRVNWGTHPQAAGYPGIVLNVVGDREDIHMNGPDGLSSARVQIDCYDMSNGGAKSLADRMRAALNGYRGGLFQGVFLESVRDMRDMSRSGLTDQPFRTSLDFMVKYER